MRMATYGFQDLGDGREWSYRTRSFGSSQNNALGTPLYQLLRWILEQVNLGNWEPRFDDEGEGVSVLIGREAALIPEGMTTEEFAERRHLAVALAGAAANAYAGGDDPESSNLLEDLRYRALGSLPAEQNAIELVHNANAWRNMEMHYAFRLIDILERVRERVFDFSAPPIAGKLPQRVRQRLREATVAYFYGLNAAAVALCRSLMQDALRDRIDNAKLAVYRKQRPRDGELQCAIDFAAEMRLLSGTARTSAHRIRRVGNEIMHPDGDKELSDDTTRQTLKDIRVILEELCAA